MSSSPIPCAANNYNKDTNNNINAFIQNEATYLDYYKRLRMLALSMFEWKNLPNNMNERFLELTLYSDGIACIVNDEEKGFMNLRTNPSNQLNVYHEADIYECYSIEYSKEYKRDNIVLIYNNMEAFPTDSTINLFAHRLARVERIIDVNIGAQRTPFIIKSNSPQKLTITNFMKNIDNNDDMCFISDEMDKLGEITVLNTNTPYVADKLSAYKKNLWAEALSFLGINNVDTEKKSHLITAEVESNNQLISLSAQTMLLTRKQACKEFNKKFNMSIDVDLRTNIDGNIIQEQGEYDG